MRDHNPSRTRICVATLAIGALSLGLVACGDSRSQPNAGGEVVAEGSSLLDTSACPPEALAPLEEGETIKIGQSLPLSGPIAPVAALVQAGAQAVVDRTNEEGGIGGHQLELIVRDNGFDPAREATNVQELVGQEGVFIVMNQITTSMLLGTEPTLREACVPQLSAITTNFDMGDIEEFSWTMMGIPPADAESDALARWLAEQKPGATVLEIRQENELGEDFAKAFKGRAEAAGLTVLDPVTVSPVATTFDTQIAGLVTSGADAVFAQIQGPACSIFMQGLARAGWEGTTLVSSACNGAKQYFLPIGQDGDGVVAPFYTVDPGDPANAEDPRLATYFADMAEFQPNADAYGSNALDAYAAMELTVAGLRQALESEPGLTKASLLEGLRHFEVTRDYFLKPEQSTDGAADPYMIDYFELRQYDSTNGGWQELGVSYDYVRP